LPSSRFISSINFYFEGEVILLLHHGENDEKEGQFTNWKIQSSLKKGKFEIKRIEKFNANELKLYVTRQVTGN
jgi:hypothetical protein